MGLVSQLRVGVGERSGYLRTGALRRNEVLPWLEAILSLRALQTFFRESASTVASHGNNSDFLFAQQNSEELWLHSETTLVAENVIDSSSCTEHPQRSRKRVTGRRGQMSLRAIAWIEGCARW